MPVDSTTAARWNDLHRDPRHQLRYPSEHVVRWLAGLPISEGRALDIGCGFGRHLRLLRNCGFGAVGVDLAAGSWTEHHDDMRRLGFASNQFDLALSYGVFYYGTRDDMRQAVKEMHRVMRPGGHGFLCLRSALDWRAEHLKDGVLDLPGEPEDGMQMTFLDGRDLANIVLAPFKTWELNMTYTTTDDSARTNFDWLVSVTK